ncbi:MAG: DUF2635 domain-containing protein [Ahrensia sp.]|nr:DUF2635 domain-containing protein [Ahrensia sp.]
MEMRKLKSVEGRVVPFEDGRPWPTKDRKDGKFEPQTVEVPFTRYYRRRVADGDLVDVKAQAEQSKAEQAKAEQAKPEPTRTSSSKGVDGKTGGRS